MRRVTATKEAAANRVLVGPKHVNWGYVRIVAQKDGSGRIESINSASRQWLLAPDSVTFVEVRSAPRNSCILGSHPWRDRSYDLLRGR